MRKGGPRCLQPIGWFQIRTVVQRCLDISPRLDWRCSAGCHCCPPEDWRPPVILHSGALIIDVVLCVVEVIITVIIVVIVVVIFRCLIVDQTQTTSTVVPSSTVHPFVYALLGMIIS